MVYIFTPCKPFLSPGLTEFYYIRQYIRKHEVLYDTRIMVYKGMVYKGKYSISEKNKGMQVSIFGYF